MALSDPKFQVVLTFAETSGGEVTRTYEADSSITTIAGFETEWALRRATVLALTDDVLVKEVHQIVLIEEDVTLPAAAENSNQALLSAKLVGKTDSGVLSIPAAKAAIFVAASGKNYDVVDTSNTNVINFLTMFSATGKFVFSDGDKLVLDTASGKRRNVKNSKS
jgi:hypothetical protein